MAKNIEHKAKRGGATIPTRTNLYAHTAKNGKAMIDFLVGVVNNDKVQMSVRVSAANKILDKILPDQKAIELTGEDQGPLQIRIIEDAKNNNNE